MPNTSQVSFLKFVVTLQINQGSIIPKKPVQQVTIEASSQIGFDSFSWLHYDKEKFVAKEICKLIKKSPQRETLLKKLSLENKNAAKSVYTFCQTRWTVCGETLASLVNNHNELMAV